MDAPSGSDFNWVAARQKCSAPHVFKQLEKGAVSDVEARNRLREERGEGKIKFSVQADDTTFSVLVQGARTGSVEFTLTGEMIVVTGHQVAVEFRATSTLTSDGKCRLTVDGHELEGWQVLRMALEPIFF